MIEVFKITHNYYDSDVAVELPLNTSATTTGSKFKLENYSFHYDLRKYSFCPHIVNVWNSLPDYVVDMDNLDKFSTCIDEFWQHQKVLFNYKSELSGTGNRSQI